MTLQNLGYKIENLPDDVKNGEQNISIKISPVFDLELITKFNPNILFSDALIASEIVESNELIFNVLSFNDLIQSKISSSRAKDKLDVDELHKIQLRKKNDG